MKLKKLLALLLALAFMASACGGGDETDTAADNSSDTSDTMADESSDTSDTMADESSDGEAMADGELATDYGVTADKVIRVGLNADLSGPFAALVSDIVEGQKVYWEDVNANGGINGYMVEPVVLDSGYATDKGIENYGILADESEEGVLMISENTGSPITAAIAQDAADDNMLVIPLSWASLWPDPEFGEAVLEKQTTYCIESMNGVSWLKDKVEADGKEAKLAIISRPGEYGEDGAAGAELAAEELGIDVVYNGKDQVAGDDRTAVISELTGSGATMVWNTLTPAELLDIFGQSVSGGFDAIWSGNGPSFSYPVHLASDYKEQFGQYYYQSGYAVPWDTQGVPALDGLKTKMAAARPDLNISDQFVTGWIEGEMVQQIIEQAMANGDMTRAGMVAASKEVTVDFGGLSPNQSWTGVYNDDVVRESYIYDVVPEDFNLIPLSEAVDGGAGGSTGLVVEKGPFVSDLVAGYTFDKPCIEPGG